MPNIGAALVGGSLVGGIVFMLAMWAYEEYQQRNRRQAYTQRTATAPDGSSRAAAPPQPSNECSICRDDLTAPLEILPCGHLFHRQCLRKWFERRMVCPICRLRIGDELAVQYSQRLGL